MCFIMKTCEQRHPTLQHSGLESYCSSVSGLYEVWPEPWTSQEWYVLDPSVELFPAKMTEPFSSLTPLPFLWPVYCQRIPKRPETLVEGSQPAKWKIINVPWTVHHDTNFTAITNLMHRYLYSYNITIPYMFQALLCSSSGGSIVYVQHLVPSLWKQVSGLKLLKHSLLCYYNL